MAAEFDLASARAAFPALSQKQVYLDNAGGSQCLGTVIDSIVKYLSTNNVQLGASYPIGQASTAATLAGEAAGAKYINASINEVVFGAATTQLFRNLSQTFEFKEGDEIVVSQIDHEANIAPWVDLAKNNNLILKWWKPKDLANPKLQADDLAELITSRTRLVTCTHASNILGTIQDIPAIAKAVHTIPGALLAVDGVAYAPHRPLDVKAFGVDFYSFSWYKVYGPHCSMLYASREAQKQMTRTLGHYFNPTATLKDKLGLAAGSEKKWEGMISQEMKLQSILLEYLNSKPEITVRGETNPDPKIRVPTISFNVEGRKSQDVVEAVEAESNFGFRWGGFYSNRLVADLLGLGDDGIIRVSMVHYNTEEEIRGIIAAIDKVISK